MHCLLRWVRNAVRQTSCHSCPDTAPPSMYLAPCLWPISSTRIRCRHAGSSSLQRRPVRNVMMRVSLPVHDLSHRAENFERRSRILIRESWRGSTPGLRRIVALRATAARFRSCFALIDMRPITRHPTLYVCETSASCACDDPQVPVTRRLPASRPSHVSFGQDKAGLLLRRRALRLPLRIMTQGKSPRPAPRASSPMQVVDRQMVGTARFALRDADCRVSSRFLPVRIGQPLDQLRSVRAYWPTKSPAHYSAERGHSQSRREGRPRRQNDALGNDERLAVLAGFSRSTGRPVARARGGVHAGRTRAAHP